MARNESALANHLAYYGIRAFGTALQCLPIERNLSIAGRVGGMWARRDGRRRKRAAENIARSFPEFDAATADDLARRSMRYLIQFFGVELVSTPRLITPGSWPRYLRLGEVTEAIRLILDRRPLLFITGHCGNFELLGYGLATIGFPLTALARPLDMPRVNDWVISVRERRGMNVITKFGAIERLPALLEQRRPVAFIADQNAGDRGVFVPFFGRLASAYKSIALLAMRYDATIICGACHREHPNRFGYAIDVYDVIEPEAWAEQDDAQFYITARYTRAIEEMVRRHPEQYFWVHRRWKSRPRHERLGRPFPDRLRARLERLPWMTPGELDRIIANSAEDTARLRARS